MSERYYDPAVTDKEIEADDMRREDADYLCEGPLPDDEPEPDVQVAIAEYVSEVRRVAA